MAEEVISEVKEEKPKKQNFFKTTSFKCIVVLLAIVLVCGILLTFCNALFEVTDEERLNRTLSSVYGEDVDTDYIYTTDLDGVSLKYDNGTIVTTELEVDGKDVEIAAFKILSYTATGEAINDYLVKVTGIGGFSGGSVTCWIAFTMDEEYTAITGVRQVTIGDNSGQSYISKIKDSNLEYFATEYDGSDYSVQLGSGATYSMTAITNAVNTGMYFVSNELCEPVVIDNNTAFENVLTAVYGSVQSYEYITYGTQTLTYTNGSIELTPIDVTNSDETVTETSVVAFKIDDKNDYLVKVTGTGGFGGGTVTCWVAFTLDENYKNITAVRKVVIDSNVSQSYISKITDSVLESAFSTYTDGDFDVKTSTGATYTMTAITNAVNTAKSFVTSVLIGGAQ